MHSLPKLLLPPFKAHSKSGLDVEFASTMEPSASTTSNCETVSQVQPYRGEVYDRPLPRVKPPIP